MRFWYLSRMCRQVSAFQDAGVFRGAHWSRHLKRPRVPSRFRGKAIQVMRSL